MKATWEQSQNLVKLGGPVQFSIASVLADPPQQLYYVNLILEHKYEWKNCNLLTTI